MFDTVHMEKRAQGRWVDFREEVAPYLEPSSIVEHTSNNGRDTKITGLMGNYSVTITPAKVGIYRGSLCKWYLGNNFQALTRGDVKIALEKIADTLHLSMEDAKITRMDVGASMIVSHPVECILNHIGHRPYTNRAPYPSGLYYWLWSNSGAMHFYDKIKEALKKREPIPKEYRGRHVMRYELRYMNRLSQLLKVPEVTGSMLYDEAFYNMLRQRWAEEYMKIDKLNDMNIDITQLTDKKGFETFANALAVEKLRGEIKALEWVKEMQKNGDMDRKTAYRLREKIKAACRADGVNIVPNPGIAELTEKIEAAAKGMEQTSTPAGCGGYK